MRPSFALVANKQTSGSLQLWIGAKHNLLKIPAFHLWRSAEIRSHLSFECLESSLQSCHWTSKHVTSLSARCFFKQLRQLCCIGRSLDDDSIATLGASFVELCRQCQPRRL